MSFTSSAGLSRRSADVRNRQEREILAQLEARRPVTQRSLASDLGIALGLTNLLMRRLVKKGWVRIKRVSARRILYLITPAGITAKAELTRQCFVSSLAFYRETRTRVRERLGMVSADLQATAGPVSGRVAFCGAGEVAEVAYICLAEVGLELIGVVDTCEGSPFLHFTIRPFSSLAGGTLDGLAFERLIVMPFQDEAMVRGVLTAHDVPPDRVFWL